MKSRIFASTCVDSSMVAIVRVPREGAALLLGLSDQIDAQGGAGIKIECPYEIAWVERRSFEEACPDMIEAGDLDGFAELPTGDADLFMIEMGRREGGARPAEMILVPNGRYFFERSAVDGQAPVETRVFGRHLAAELVTLP